MRKPIAAWIILGFFLFSLSGGVLGIILTNDKFFADQKFITFSDQAGDQLLGTYTPGTHAFGVILLEGFGSDQIALRPAASIFRKTGAHIFSFDFSGHGRSPGGLGFDNAATDRLANQVIAAKETFKSLSGLDEDQMLYFGHSLGARVALQAAALDSTPPAALVLLGTQVNLGANLQSEFFTGTSDIDLEWVQSLSAKNPRSHILLFSGGWDDILTPQAAKALIEKLSTGNEGNDLPFSRQLSIIPGLLHNYEIYSTRLLKQMASQLEQLGILSFPGTTSLSAQYLFGGLALGGLLGTLITAPAILSKIKPKPAPSPQRVHILRFKRFIRGKLLLWFSAVPIAALLTGLFFLIPLDLPVLNLIYVGFIGGYGILMFTLYLVGKVPGTEGKCRFETLIEKGTSTARGVPWLGLLFWVLILLACVIFTRAGIFYIIPLNQRLIWLGIFSPITALGFWINSRETCMVEIFKHESGRKLPRASLLLSLIGLTPFFIYTIFMAILGSLSGMIGGLHGLLILSIVILTGNLLYYLIHKAWLIALLQAVLLYALVLPQNVLFTL